MKVEKNIGLPSKTRKTKYPWRDMEVGDSFLWPRPFSTGEQTKAVGTANSFCKRSPDCKDWKFSCRKTDDDKIRIFRIK